MDRPNLYEDDILAWSEEQAAALRKLAKRHDLPNELDLDNVVEEIEAVGRNELRAATSLIRVILTHLAKAASTSNAPARAHWATECAEWNAQLEDAFAPSMRDRINIGREWRRALHQATKALAEHGESLAPHLPASCPFTVDELLAPDFEFNEAAKRLSPP